MDTSVAEIVRSGCIVGAIGLNVVVSAAAQVIEIPDIGLKTAIWSALGKSPPVGPLTAEDMLGLTSLDATSKAVRTLEGLGGAANLTSLKLDHNDLKDISFPRGLTNLSTLSIDANGLTNLSLPTSVCNLSELSLWGNSLSDFSFLNGLTNLTWLDLSANQLRSFSVPSGLTRLKSLYLTENGLTNVFFPSSLTNLKAVWLYDNDLSNLTLPPELAGLTWLQVNDNPLTTLIYPEPLLRSDVASEIEFLRKNGVSVYPYSVAVSIVSAKRTQNEGFGFTVNGPPGAYRIQVSSNFSEWTDLDSVANILGIATFNELMAGRPSQRFYRVKLTPGLP